MARLNEKQFRRKLRKLEKAISESVKVAEIAGIKTLEGLMKRRIFNKGLATDGRALGSYSPGYAKTRRAKGRQVRTKDLEFTGQLRRDLVTGTSKGHAALGFQTVRSKNIAAYQEEPQQVGRLIWRPTDDEINDMESAMVKAIQKRIIRALR